MMRMTMDIELMVMVLRETRGEEFRWISHKRRRSRRRARCSGVHHVETGRGRMRER